MEVRTLDLQEIRGQLDVIDRELVALYEKRMKLCGEVAEFKIATGKPVYDGEREKQKLEAVAAMAGEEYRRGAVELFTQIMTISRRLQYRLLAENGKTVDTGFTQVDQIPVKGAKVVYQGVEGAYSHEATMEYFGEDVDAYHVKTWEEAMKAVESGQADYAVLPIENSSAGAVSDNYDLLIKYHNYIVAEVFLPVKHALLGVPGGSMEQIHTVFSHPQALMQCSEFLNSHGEWSQISVENTAVAAKKVLEENDPSQAAVASEAAARLYGLTVLREGINYNKDNVTRFIVVARHPVYRKDAGKISLCFELPHRSGTLYNMLSNFIYNDVNMFMIQSRPIPGRNWEYRFFVDIEGRLDDPAVNNALKGIAEESATLRVLGNY
ncbi:prephenate dehydratase [Lachnoclostridium sp. An14]|uniref:prephenate dehydratase n=1 Tax=Lachnoclostridium sp. An14 TaxID=1965562 RepID=UPI002E8E489F|nr:prephenate dehydratase [Lachnoclostridium sp. An14]